MREWQKGDKVPVRVVEKSAYDALAEKLKAAEAERDALREADALIEPKFAQLRERVAEEWGQHWTARTALEKENTALRAKAELLVSALEVIAGRGWTGRSPEDYKCGVASRALAAWKAKK